jgi:2,3-bisphosphoglycerate-independent phosphoglycerate mutase
MYRGLAGMVGMNVLECGQGFEDELIALEENVDSGFDYFFLHYKPADSAGEDGDFKNKVRQLEVFDSYIPRIRDLDPDVLVICGDHSTPSLLSGHSWHPVPFLINSSHSVPNTEYFDEESCISGSIGSIQAEHLMLSVLANAGKLHKYGA